ncbi:hypothetical protein PN398_07310 [Romboutsia sp. 1001216sp1]|uniref:hypothetical protein n=3 Tax=Romboutsia sp. 1001216sp1 TaxID=2986997 RepID=UPI00232AD676|nr:hypothetical protein [Romboutsia sp. 1001216sp1]MDB8790524.1 hypothetical protein [Romboutsia sp. 1001216sp1]
MGLIDIDRLLELNTSKEIIDEILNKTYSTKGTSKDLYAYVWKNGKRVKLEGHYIKFSKLEKKEHEWDTLFFNCEKYYIKELCGYIESTFEEEHRADARLLTYEILLGLDNKFNKSFSKRFKMNMKNVKDLKKILLDKKLSRDIKNYIIKTVINRAKQLSYDGKNQDIVQNVVTKNKVKTVQKTELSYFFLDKKLGNSENDDDGYRIVDGVIDEDDLFLDNVITETIHEDDSNNIYAYINENVYSMLTDKQYEYFKAKLVNKEKELVKCSVTRNGYEKRIKDNIDIFLSGNKNINLVNGKYEVKDIALIDTISDILDDENNYLRFLKLVKYLRKENKISDQLSKIIYELDFKYIKTLIEYLQLESTNEYTEIYVKKYCDKEFIQLLNKFNKFLHSQSRFEIYLFNKSKSEERETRIKRYIENNIFANDKEVGSILRKKLVGYISMEELRMFLCEVYSKNIPKEKVRGVLLEHGYEMEKCPKTTIKGIRRFKVSRKS